MRIARGIGYGSSSVCPRVLWLLYGACCMEATQNRQHPPATGPQPCQQTLRTMPDAAVLVGEEQRCMLDGMGEEILTLVSLQNGLTAEVGTNI